MDLEKAIYSLKLHSSGAGLGNGTCVVNIEDVETVLSELEKKDGWINVMQAEFERLEGIEDNTIMMKYELEKKDLILNEMAKYIAGLDIDEDICKNVEGICENYAGENRKLCNGCVKEYFTKKCECMH